MKTNPIIMYIMVAGLLAWGCGRKDRSSEPAVTVEEVKYKEMAPADKMDKVAFTPLPEADTEGTKGDTTQYNTEEYDRIVDNPFKDAKSAPLSTFSIDVDNASYSNVRRIINSGMMPDKGAVRIEEFINYFEYNYPQPEGDKPFSITTEVWEAPWAPGHQLVRIGLQGKKPDYAHIKPGNLVFLLDTSGSMESEDKLPLLRKTFMMMVDNLPAGSRVAIVAYAGSAGLVLPSTPVDEKEKIKEALSGLQAGGSTAGGEGLQLAYKVASENFIDNGNNRVILATDGDFNVGVSSRSGLMDLIEKNKGNEIFLTICGFGMGNYKDATMEEISNWGDGNYFYIDTMEEAKKVFGKELMANLFVIAKDVKIQVEFNPAQVQAYRLIGYENRIMADEDFNDDLKDAGELGAGHRVTALYEIVPIGVPFNLSKTDTLKYQEPRDLNMASIRREIMTVKLRYKPLKSDTSILQQKVVMAGATPWEKASADSKFVSAVAGFGMLLRDSQYKGKLNYDMLKNITGDKQDTDPSKAEFITLVNKAAKLSEK